MPFMVIYRTSDGSSCHELTEAIDEAALFVERLRNQEGIDQIQIYRMEEITFAFRPYYKVELGHAERTTTPQTPAAGSKSVSEIPPPPQPEAKVAADTEVEAPPPLPARPTNGEAVSQVRPDSVTDGQATMALPVPPPPGADGEAAGATGRRGLFGR